MMRPVSRSPLLPVLALLLALGLQSGCAAKKTAQPAEAPEDTGYPQIADPLEPWNRFWFGFNDVFYMGIGKPFSKGYTTVMPKYARERIENAYSNLLFPARFMNAILQLRPDKASRELGRFIINSTFGLGGLYDLAAAKPDMKPQRLDFGQTLGVWGLGHGFYLILPVVGPTSLRDTVGMVVDATAQPTTYIDAPYVLTVGISAAGRINRLPEMIDIYEEIKRASLEPYVSTRDAYAQLRARMIQEALKDAWVKTGHQPQQ